MRQQNARKAQDHPGEAGEGEPDAQEPRQETRPVHQQPQRKEPQTPKYFVDNKSVMMQIDKEGYALRDPDSTTYSGAIETAEEFGKRIFIEAWKRGWSRAQKKVVLGDGAEWIWNLVAEHFPGAIQIVDLYHACQHLWEVVRRLYPNNQGNQKTWMKVHQQLLEKGKIEKLVLSLRSIGADNPDVAEKIRTKADYFERNAGRMRYPKFRRQHLFVGSGVIEAGCKTVIGSRLKRSGMFWTVRGANAILALRCCHLNRRFEDYWEDRRAA